MYIVHVKTVHRNERLHKCKMCSKTYASKHKLDIHIANKHSDVGEGEKYKCKEKGCTYGTNDPSDFKKHTNKHTRRSKVNKQKGVTDKFHCAACNYKTSRKDLLKRHMKYNQH